MKRFLLGSVALLTVTAAGSAGAADLIPAYKAPPPVLWSWSGFYIGGHLGSALGLNNIDNPLGPSIFGDKVRSPGPFGGGQIGFNWQAPGSSFLFGVEADASFGNLDGTNTCYAFSGTFDSFNCRAHTDAFGTLTARVGVAFGPQGRSLAYVRGGAAWGHSNVDMVINNNLFGIFGTSSTSFNSWGWTVGAGAEYAMTSNWTVRAGYDYIDLGRHDVAAPSPSITTIPEAGAPLGIITLVPGTSVAQQIHAFKLGVNYKFGPSIAFADGFGGMAAQPAYGGKGPDFKARPVAAAWAPGWEVEGGFRYWYSSGRFQKDIAPDNIGSLNPMLNISRLTWDNMKGNSAEMFLRVDTPSKWFVKGLVGGGKLSGGKINDEDWGIDANFAGVNTGYSNTEGNASGTLSYATADVGYDVFRGAGYKVGVFAGYNIYTDNKTSTSCVQFALPQAGICNPPINVFILGENDKWQSLRLGANAEVMLTPQWKIVADVAYLPYVRFDGQDYHPLRPFLAQEWGKGLGTQVEAFVYYYLTPQFSIGAGGRYWAMWTTSGANCREPPNGNCPSPLQDVQYKTERIGVLLQAAYKFDEPLAPVFRK